MTDLKSLDLMPGPKPFNNPLVILPVLQKLNSGSLDGPMEWMREYGETIKVDFLNQRNILTSNPETMRQILVSQSTKFGKPWEYNDHRRGLARFVGQSILTSDGDFWRKQRKLVQPAFHTRRIGAYADDMGQLTTELIAGWREGEKVDISHQMMKLTLRIVAKTLFNTNLDEHINVIHDAMKTVNEVAGHRSLLPSWLPTLRDVSANKANRDIDAVVYQFIKEWREQGEDRGDLLSMLMMAQDDEGQHMTDEQVRNESITLLLAGHETTANTLTWTFKLLAENPHIAQKLHAEVDQVLQGRVASLEDLPNLPYTEMVIKESMRLMPAVSIVGRIALEDAEIEGYHVPKGTEMALLWVFTHRNERYWKNPEAFEPERFNKENSEQIARYTYLPFGAGPRLCIGNSFAMMEAQIILATIAQHYQLALIPNHEVIALSHITTYPKDGLPMIAHQRHTEAVLLQDKV